MYLSSHRSEKETLSFPDMKKAIGWAIPEVVCRQKDDTLISLRKTNFVSLKCAVGPSGKPITRRASEHIQYKVQYFCITNKEKYIITSVTTQIKYIALFLVLIKGTVYFIFSSLELICLTSNKGTIIVITIVQNNNNIVDKNYYLQLN